VDKYGVNGRYKGNNDGYRAKSGKNKKLRKIGFNIRAF